MASDYDPSRGHCPEETQEISQIDKQLGEVWPTFVNLYHKKNKEKQKEGWPYEVSAGKPVDLPCELSFSTSAMILFAMGLRLGHLSPGVLAPETRRAGRFTVSGVANQEKFRKRFDSIFHSGIKLVAERSSELSETDTDGKPLVVTSGTFGGNDPFTMAWLLNVASGGGLGKKVESLRGDIVGAAVRSLDKVFKNPETALFLSSEDGAHAVDHVFPVLGWLHVYRLLTDEERAKESELTGNPQTVVRPYFLDRIHSHLSFASIRHSDFDAAELVFALEGLLLLDDHPRRADLNLIKRVFDIVAERQETSAYWRPLKPFVTKATGHALLPLSVEIANSLLRICKRLEHPDAVNFLFSERLNLFKRYTEWLLTRVVEGAATHKDKGQFKFVGWHSEHVREPGKCHPWQTARVAVFLMHYRIMLEAHVARQSLRDAKLSISQRPDSKDERETPSKIWAKEWAEPINSSNGPTPRPEVNELKNTCLDTEELINKYYIQPREDSADESRRKQIRYSMLLYGPPGTGKTRVAKRLAEALNYPMITITPSNFLAGGEAEVEMRATSIFDALNKQFDCVILFDEIDQLILDRESSHYKDQTGIFKFMTPGMLTKLTDLHDCKRSIFIISTNYEDRIDRAAKRKGRIDDRLPIGPPDSTRRRIILQREMCKKLRDLEKPDKKSNAKEIVGLLAMTDLFLTVKNKTVFRTYGELIELVDDAFKKRCATKRTVEEEVAQLAEDLKTALEDQQEPAIRLMTYKNRFNSKMNERAPQAPILEFLVLLFLLRQASVSLEKEDRDLSFVVLAQLRGKKLCAGQQPKDEVAEALRDVVKEESVRKTLMELLATMKLIK